MTRRSRSVLRWLEGALFMVGGGLAVWCLIVILRTEYYARLPVPPPPVASRPSGGAMRLPGEEGDEHAPASPRPTARDHGSWLARLEAPAAHLAATVLEGSDDATLARAAGHIEDTAFPGEHGNVAIAGHRDTIFRPVRRLHVGDVLTLTTADRVLQYRVANTKVVDPEDVSVLDATAQPTLTLVTCYPFEFIGHAPRRFIVRADLVAEEARVQQPEPGPRAPLRPAESRVADAGRAVPPAPSTVTVGSEPAFEPVPPAHAPNVFTPPAARHHRAAAVRDDGAASARRRRIRAAKEATRRENLSGAGAGFRWVLVKGAHGLRALIRD